MLPPAGGLLALDVSKLRIGLAGTDSRRALVTPLMTLKRGRWVDDAAKLQRVVSERQAVGIVVGLPLNMDGSEGDACRSVRAVAWNLDALLGLPLYMQDERLTTAAVAAAIDEGRLKRPKRGHSVDHYAAAVILQDALRDLNPTPRTLDE